MSDFPQSTYRIQFHAGFTFSDAAAIVPYLHDLGVTHCYASPYLKARPGSTHGYDVIDHCSLNPELGSEADFAAWLEAMRAHGMSHILDIVPNHVGVATNDNKWWNDVLEHGRASKYAEYFDIAWEGAPRPELHDKVLIPILGEPYGRALESGTLRLEYDPQSARYWVACYDRRFPIDPKTAPPRPIAADDHDALDGLLSRQHYRLAYWRTASDEINYRRFFDINDLAALSMERPEVFDASHELILRLVREGKVAGLRIDHPDGLYDPRQYFQRLQARASDSSDLKSQISNPVYVVVEKILAADEHLPRDWPVHGTSGYDFLNMVNGLFVDPAGEEPLTRLYGELTAEHRSFNEIAYEKKLLMLRTNLASELHMLAHRLDRLAQRHRHWRDFTLLGLIEGLRQVIACFPVYRSYVSDEGLSETDRRYIETAVGRAIARSPKTDPSVFHFVRDVLTLQYPASFTESDRAEQRRFAARFQQLTAPATAKGVEDTAFYVYNRLISLNEVGGEPSRFGVSAEQLHAYFRDRQAQWPWALSALSTHDTKRSEDVRARINVLSEMPEEWATHVKRWFELNAAHRRETADATSPSSDEEYLLYQTLIGSYPLDAAETGAPFVQRIQAYVLKAMREAKVRTSWTDPDARHENAVTEFVSRILDGRTGAAFLAEFLPFQKRVADLGLVNSLAQTLLRLTAPGVPDTYQGAELMDLSLVDPDNRRPVDYALRRQMLDDLRRTGEPPAIDDPRMKLFITSRALSLRRQNPGLFTTGDYLPLHASGELRDHVFAFARRDKGRWAIVIVPRLIAGIARGAWGGTSLHLPTGVPPLQNLFTRLPLSAPVMLADLLAEFPVALLHAP